MEASPRIAGVLQCNVGLPAAGMLTGRGDDAGAFDVVGRADSCSDREAIPPVGGWPDASMLVAGSRDKESVRACEGGAIGRRELPPRAAEA